MVSAAQPHVLIIGAGITGLTIAQGLKARSIPFTVFETETRNVTRPREWTMGVHWGLPLLDALLPQHLRDRLPEASVDASLDYGKYPNNAPRIFDGLSGECVKELEIKDEDGSPGREMRMSRRRLRALCAEGIDVQYDHKLVSITENDNDGTVTANFAHGVMATGTILIGADSSRSYVRAHLLPDQDVSPSPLDLTLCNLTVAYKDAEKARFVRQAHPIFSLMTHPDVHALISTYEVPDPAAPETWKFQLIPSWAGAPDMSLTNAERRAHLLAKTNGLAEPFHSAYAWIPEDTEIAYQHVGYWIAEQPWDTRSGRITLAGDAAHPMPPHRGQGLNNALMDAYNLVEAIERVVKGEAEQAFAIQKASEEIAERGAKEVRLSVQTALMSMDHEKIKSSALFSQGFAREESKT